MRGKSNRRVTIGGLLFLIGTIALIASSLSVWYVITDTTYFAGAGGSITNAYQGDFKPGESYINSASSSCSGSMSAACPASQSYSCPYSGGGGQRCYSDGLKQTGELYLLIDYLLAGGIVLGFIGTALALLSHRIHGLRTIAMAIGVVGLLLALMSPLVLLVWQPGAVKIDYTQLNGSAPKEPGPWSSFFGSCANSSGNCLNEGIFPTTVSTAWSPGIGWYLSFGASLAFLTGLIILRFPKERTAIRPEPSMGSRNPESPSVAKSSLGPT